MFPLVTAAVDGEGTNIGLDYWNGLLDWNNGLTYFWFSHILAGFIEFVPSGKL